MQLKSIWIWVFGVALSIWKLSIKYNFDKKINKMIQTRIHEYISEYIKRIFTIHMSILKWKMAVMASDGPSSLSLSLRVGLATTHQPSKHHHAQSLLGPSFHNPRTPYVLISYPEWAASVLPHHGERRHAVGWLPLRPYTASLSSGLQPILSLSIFKLKPSLLQIVWTACHCGSILLLLDHSNPIFESLCVSLPLPQALLPLLFWRKWTSALSP